MNSIEYSYAATEVLYILNYIDKEDVKLIPQSFINFLKDISNKYYKVNFNLEEPLKRIEFKKNN